MLFVATSTQQLCRPWLDWGLMPYLACLYPLVLLLCLARSLRLLAPLTAAATACELFALAVVFYYILRDPLPPVSSVPAAASLAKFPVQARLQLLTVFTDLFSVIFRNCHLHVRGYRDCVADREPAAAAGRDGRWRRGADHRDGHSRWEQTHCAA